MKKVLLIGISLIVLVLGSLAYKWITNTQPLNQVIKIGGTFTQTGLYQISGKATIAGLSILIDEYNNKGGVLGKKIRLVSYDDKGDINEAGLNVSKLINDDKVNVIIGANINTTASAYVSTAANSNIPFLTPSAMDFGLTQKGNNIFRAIYSDTYEAKVMGEFAKNDLKARKVAVLYNFEEENAAQIANSFKLSFESNGGIVTNYKDFSEDDKDFRNILKEIITQKPDVICILDHSSEKIKDILIQAREFGITAKYLGNNGWSGVDVIVPDDLMFEAYYTCPYSSYDTSKEVQEFVKVFEQRYGRVPCDYEALGYDSGKIMLEAISSAGKLDNTAIISKLSQTNYKGVTGIIKFDSKRDTIRSVSIIKITKGKQEFFKRIDPK